MQPSNMSMLPTIMGIQALRNRDSNKMVILPTRTGMFVSSRIKRWVYHPICGAYPKRSGGFHFSIRCRRCWWKQSTGGEQMGQVPDGFPPNYGILKEHDNLPMHLGVHSVKKHRVHPQHVILVGQIYNYITNKS